jgi:hypothetical protein
MRKAVILLSTGCLLILICVAVLIYRASPGPETQEIFGVGIGDSQNDAGVVYISGRRLDCTQAEANQPFPTVCSVDILGRSLEIQAMRNPPTDPNQLAGTCAATYDGRQLPCTIGSRHVDVPWFAFIRDPLGLNQVQMEGLRHRFYFENLPQETFTAALIVVPVVAAMAVVLASGAWLWPRIRSRPSYTLLVAASGTIALFAAFFITLGLTRGFWD